MHINHTQCGTASTRRMSNHSVRSLSCSSVINKINHKHLRQTRRNIAVKSFVRTVFYFSPSLQSTLANGHALNVLRPLRSTVFVREPLKSLHTHTQNPQPLKPYGFIAGRFTWTQLTRINPASVRGRTMQSSRSRLSRLTIAKIHSTSIEIKIHF